MGESKVKQKGCPHSDYKMWTSCDVTRSWLGVRQTPNNTVSSNEKGQNTEDIIIRIQLTLKYGRKWSFV